MEPQPHAAAQYLSVSLHYTTTTSHSFNIVCINIFVLFYLHLFHSFNFILNSADRKNKDDIARLQNK